MTTGDTVAIFGCGAIGLTVIDHLKAAGADQIFVSEPRTDRCQRAEEVGADITLDPTEVDATEQIIEATNDGVDISFEAAGIELTYRAAIECVKHGGQVLTVGISEHPVEVIPRDITFASVPSLDRTATLADRLPTKSSIR
jgi:(R,R)-butanediol dehydrogenase/meso-butanediol dehydrogenase/diacetyl reductase